MHTPGLLVACLCAGWCRLCEGYAAVLNQVLDELRADGAALRLRWIDIEDEAELLGDLDVETFPTLLLISTTGRLHFAGPVTPQPEALRRLLRAALQADAADAHPAPGATAEALAVARRLHAGG